MRKPDFFIVGAPKSGTTAMATYLGQHPEIFMAQQKDSTFFGSDLNFRHNIMHPPDLFRVSEEVYLSWFTEAEKAKRVGEASVWYLYSKRAAQEIKAFNPDADIIVMLRNPVDLLYSLHAQFLYDGNEDIEDFEEALSAEGDRKRGLRIPRSAYLVEGLYYRDVVRFSEQIKRYLDLFGRQRIKVIIFEDFRERTEEIYRQTLVFLGVSPDFRPDFKVVNPSREIRSRTLQGLIASPPPPLEPIGRYLSRIGWVRRAVKWAVDRLNVSYRNRPPLKEDLRRSLLEEFYPEIAKTERLLGIDLSCWLK